MDCIIKNWFYIQFPRIYTKRQKKKIDNLHYSIWNDLFIYLTIIFYHRNTNPLSLLLPNELEWV